MPALIRGSEMKVKTQNDAKRRFVHRFTFMHRPAWAYSKRPDGSSYMPHFHDDADWLANTFFWVCKDGTLSDAYKYCESHPTFPMGEHEKGTSNV